MIIYEEIQLEEQKRISQWEFSVEGFQWIKLNLKYFWWKITHWLKTSGPLLVKSDAVLPGIFDSLLLYDQFFNS